MLKMYKICTISIISYILTYSSISALKNLTHSIQIKSYTFKIPSFKNKQFCLNNTQVYSTKQTHDLSKEI